MASKIIVDQIEKTGGSLIALTLPTGNASAGQVLQNEESASVSYEDFTKEAQTTLYRESDY